MSQGRPPKSPVVEFDTFIRDPEKDLIALDPKIYLAFIDEYLQKHQTTWTSIFGLTTRAFQWAFSKDIVSDRTQTCNQLKTEIKKIKPIPNGIQKKDLMELVDTWAEICDLLLNKAIEAEKTRTISFHNLSLPSWCKSALENWFNFDLLFTKTLHVMRSLIIHQFNEQNDDKIRPQHLLPELFKEKIAQLTKGKEDILDQMKAAKIGKQATSNIKKLKEDEKKISLKLVALNDEPSIAEAIEEEWLSGFGKSVENYFEEQYVKTGFAEIYPGQDLVTWIHDKRHQTPPSLTLTLPDLKVSSTSSNLFTQQPKPDGEAKIDHQPQRRKSFEKF